jgi:hypothetical protein
MPHSLIRLNNPVKHVRFIRAKHSPFTTDYAGCQSIASSGSSCENYENFTSYKEKSAGALTFSWGGARPLNVPRAWLRACVKRVR